MREIGENSPENGTQQTILVKRSPAQRVFDVFCAATFLVAPEDLPVHTEDIQGALKGRYPFRGEVDIETQDGIITLPASKVRDLRDLA